MKTDYITFKHCFKYVRVSTNRNRHPKGSRRWKKWENARKKLANRMGLFIRTISRPEDDWDTNEVVRLKSVELASGACPYQIEATTEDGKFFYLRYRHGRLSYGVWESEADFYNRDGRNYMFSKKIGDDYDGGACHDFLYPFIQGKVIFPDPNFTINSGFKNANTVTRNSQ